MSGYDPDARALDARARAGRDRPGVRRPWPRRSTGAEVCFVCAPVGALPALVREALEQRRATASSATSARSSGRCSTASHDDERFIGGHPLAGAEASGVEHARADLFEDATWYLTPTERSSGMLYERLYRLVSALGARPTAITADVHDRLMATVSHLPHVLANVLVGQAARELADESQGLPATGPSFRDATRVAGANPRAVARHLPVQPRGARARAGRLPRRARAACARTCAPGDPARLERWIEGARADRQRLLEADLAGGPVSELRVAVPEPAGDRRAACACARRGGYQHRRHGSLSGARHEIRARSRSGSRARAAPSAPSQLVAGLGTRPRPSDSGSMSTVRFDPVSRLAGRARRRRRTSRSRTGPRSSARCRTGACRCAATCARPTRPRRSRRSPSWARASRGPSRAARARTSSSSARGCAAPTRARSRSTCGNAGTLLRILPGWLAGQPRGQLDARRRREHPPAPGGPRRASAAAHGGERRLPRGRAAADGRRGRRPARDRVRAARSRARRSSPACCSRACWPTARPRSSSSFPRAITPR